MNGTSQLDSHILSTAIDLAAVRALHTADEAEAVTALISASGITHAQRAGATERAIDLIHRIRASGEPGLMELFLAEYGLSTNEGIALMCLAEALLRVPDPGTIDALIEDKVAPYSWREHAGQSSSAIVNASTVGLMLTGRILDDDNTSSVLGLLHRTVKRLGEPVVRAAIRRIMREMGNQFVLGQTIEEALENGARDAKAGFRHSYDMLGEAALTREDADAYYAAYAQAIDAISKDTSGELMHERPGISIKLSALHPRYELAKAERLKKELVPRLRTLARKARELNLGLNVDAEESQRLEVSLEIIAEVLADPGLVGWDGFGVVVQAYQKRATAVVDSLYRLAADLDRRIMVRLVKGAYWDTEIKQAQVDGAEAYPVFTRRAATDVSYLCCAARLLSMTDRIYPQFATHNAHTAATIMEFADGKGGFEFQRLHGMGESLFAHLLESGAACRIYAPVGPHKDLLAYLVRRLLENGANSSFVHKIVDPAVAAEDLAGDPFESIENWIQQRSATLIAPSDIFAPDRQASQGWDLANTEVLDRLYRARDVFAKTQWRAEPLLAGEVVGGAVREIHNPARPDDCVGVAVEANPDDCAGAIGAASDWSDVGGRHRAFVLRRAADLFETHAGELFALLAREAGKSLPDAVGELREAVDFLRYYANAGEGLEQGDPRGIITCIAPWNFPLAIFTGQVAAALAAGNGVLAKPAEATPLVAATAVRYLHAAGVPREVLQFLPGTGAEVGTALTQSAAIGGVCFTGSTATAQRINRTMAEHALPGASLIAETGGINAALVDSTALPEQAVRDTLLSAFQSAGQRCSALRVLFVQEDIAEPFLAMLKGAMEELALGDPWDLSTDIGPLISAAAQAEMQQYVDVAKSEGRLLKQLRAPANGHFLGPALISVDSIDAVEREIFGPVLHVVQFASGDFNAVIDAVNARGYGLTFGLHTRIDERVKLASRRVAVGNIYINRNQIGAVVESQPFGGEGLSGTGPKAGGPNYVPRFLTPPPTPVLPARSQSRVKLADVDAVQALIESLHRPEPAWLEQHVMPGPTGEANTLTYWPRGLVLCLGPGPQEALMQAGTARRMGCQAIVVAPGARGPAAIDGFLPREALAHLHGVDVVALWPGSDDSDGVSDQRLARRALASRDGALVPLVTANDLERYCFVERHSCVDTTAAGGNASLLASVEG